LPAIARESDKAQRRSFESIFIIINFEVKIMLSFFFEALVAG
jgi:hypothetical protein